MGKKKSLKNCCNHSKKDKQCIANGRVYDLPRKFSKKKFAVSGKRKSSITTCGNGSADENSFLR